MIFSKTCQQVIAGTKTLTSRPQLPKDRYWQELDDNGNFIITAVLRFGKIKYEVGQNHAVQPGRGKFGLWYHQYGDTRVIFDATGQIPIIPRRMEQLGNIPARVTIKAIDKWDIRHACQADIEAEGYKTDLEFMAAWAGFYDRRLKIEKYEDNVFAFWDGKKYQTGKGAKLVAYILERPAQAYQAWKLRINLEESSRE